MKSFACCECGTNVVIPIVVKTVSCRHCGDVYFIGELGNVRRVYPSLHMQPVTHPLPCSNYPLSKWMMPWTRPIRAGIYHCRFRHTEPHIIELMWQGAFFVVPSTGERVDTSHLLTWRGVLV